MLFICPDQSRLLRDYVVDIFIASYMGKREWNLCVRCDRKEAIIAVTTLDWRKNPRSEIPEGCEFLRVVLGRMATRASVGIFRSWNQFNRVGIGIVIP